MSKRKTKNEFRYNKITKHHNYIFEEDGDDFHSLGLTSHNATRDRKNKWHTNMPLDNNPKRNDTKHEHSYIRYGYITQNKNTFGKVDRRFNFSNTDMPKVKSKIRKFKNKRRKRQ